MDRAAHQSAAHENAWGIVVHAYGDWQDVTLGPVSVALPGPDEVLIAAEAAALNFPDALIIAGKYQNRPPLPFTPGRDVAGTIFAVGSAVQGFVPGDRVAAQPPYGAFATRVLADQGYCFHIPAGLSSVDAAASGTVLATVAAALGLRARLREGESVMLTGAAGGVGTAAIQYARMLGARVVAVVSSAAKEAAARDAGAEIVLRTDGMTNLRDDLRTALSAHLPHGVDAVMDVVGGDTFDGAIRCVRAGGRCVVVGFASGRIPTIATNYLLLKDIALIGSSLDRLFRTGDPELRGLVEAGFEAIAAGRMRIPVEQCYPLGQFQAAMARIAERRAIGKIVLAPLRGADHG